MKVLVTGGCGYIGARLVPFLLADGHKVAVRDPQIFGHGHMSDNASLTVNGEDDADVVIHLASISQNDMYAVNSDLTSKVNRELPKHDRIIYASSVAAYGSSAEVMTEESSLRPTTPYGWDKAFCEAKVLEAGGTVVRAASACGHSANMRFDTPINRMTRDALTSGKLRVNGGSQMRCHIHLDDLCDFYRLLLKEPEKIKGHAFNAVAESSSIRDSAALVADVTGAEVQYANSTDDRTYRVSGDKARSILGWKPSRSIRSAISQMKAHFESGNEQYRDFSSGRMRMM